MLDRTDDGHFSRSGEAFRRLPVLAGQIVGWARGRFKPGALGAVLPQLADRTGDPLVDFAPVESWRFGWNGFRQAQLYGLGEGQVREARRSVLARRRSLRR